MHFPTLVLPLAFFHTCLEKLGVVFNSILCCLDLDHRIIFFPFLFIFFVFSSFTFSHFHFFFFFFSLFWFFPLLLVLLLPNHVTSHILRLAISHVFYLVASHVVLLIALGVILLPHALPHVASLLSCCFTRCLMRYLKCYLTRSLPHCLTCLSPPCFTHCFFAFSTLHRIWNNWNLYAWWNHEKKCKCANQNK